MNTKFYTSLAALVVAGMLSGCSSHMMAIKYEPSSKPARHNTLEKVYVGNVLDSRGTKPNWLGAIRGGYGNPLKKLYTDDVTAKVIAKAFEDALRVRGLLGLASASQYRIDVTLLKFDTSYYFNKEAHAYLTMSLVNAVTGNTIFSRAYRTDNEKGGVGAGIFGDVDALASFANETLNETIDKALGDPNFIAALKAPAQVSGQTESIASRLKKLEELRKQGLITQEEYEGKRKSLISGF